MDEFIATFHIDWKLMIAQMINFGLVFGAFYILASKPLRKLMNERSNEIKKGLEDAKKNSELLKITKDEYENVLTKARAEANSLFEKGKKEAIQKKEAMLKEAKEEVANMIENGKKTLESEKTKMVNEAKKEIISLILKSTEKVIDKKVDDSVNERFIKDLVNL